MSLPVREMILYKHGVGFFIREGAVRGTSTTLTFRHDEINDVLKSLAVFDKSGGQVLGIHYQTPMDIEHRLANSSIRLSDQASLRDLIRDLRGRKITLLVENAPGSSDTITGRVIGLDERAYGETDFSTVSLLAENIQVFPFQNIRGLTVHDEQSAQDLSYFLDTSMSEDTRRTVTLRLSKGAHQLAVYYVAPSPTWRVSYRLVAESEQDGTGKALLQGWGLFDNRLEEDLEEVRVTLVAGQPISFIYDLYTSRIPPRRVVQDESRIAPGPVEYQGLGISDAEIAELQASGTLAPIQELNSLLKTAMSAEQASAPYSRADLSADAREMRRAPAPASKAAMAQSLQPAAEAKESGEFFQYQVTTPVTVKRGESALVPIIGKEVSYQRELLYNGQKLPKHPVAALRFINNTGLTLERGPVTVVEDSDYRGEAVIPFTKDGNEVYVPYAVELGITVTEKPNHFTENYGLNIKEGYLVFQEYQVMTVTYVLENTTAKDQIVTLEAPISSFALFETPTPEVETATERRWKIKVPARGKVEFLRKERMQTHSQMAFSSLNYRQLSEFFSKHWLDQSTFNELAALLDQHAFIQNVQKEHQKLQQERDIIYKQQEQLRANLGALQPVGDEAALRKRVLVQLESTQDRTEAITQRLTDIAQQVAAAEEKIKQIIAGLNEGK